MASGFAELAQVKTLNSTKTNQVRDKRAGIAKLKSEQDSIGVAMKNLETQASVHEQLTKQLTDRFQATVQRMMKEQNDGDVRLLAEKAAIEKTKHTSGDIEAQMVAEEAKFQTQIEELTAEKENTNAEVTKQRMEAEANAQKAAEEHAKSTKENANTADDATKSIFSARETAAAVDEKNAAQQQAIAQAVMKVHEAKNQEAAEILTQIAELEAQVAAEYSKTSSLTKEKAAKFQMQVEAVAAEEKEAGSSLEMGKETDRLKGTLADLERKVATLAADKAATLKDQTKAAALAVANQERAEAEVGNAKLRGMALEAAARLKEQKEVAKLEKEKSTTQQKISEVQETHQERSETAAEKIKGLRSEVAAKDQEVEELENQYRSIRNDLKEASAKLVLAQPEGKHSVPVTPAAGSGLGAKKGRDDDDDEDDAPAKRKKGSGRK